MMPPELTKEAMIRQECIPIDAPEAWKQALEGIRHSFFHSWEHCYARHLSMQCNPFLYTFEMDEVKIVCPFYEREYEGYTDLVTPYGVPGFVGNKDCRRFASHWKDFAKDRGYVCGYIGLNPLLSNDTYFDRDEAITYNHVFVLDLRLPYEVLFSNLHLNRKRQLRGWSMDDSKAVVDDPEVADFFVDNYVNFIADKGAPESYYYSKESLRWLTSLENVFVVGMKEEGDVVCVSVFAYTPDAGEYLFNISTPEGRQHSVELLWYGANVLKSLQVPFLNLGGGAHEQDGMAQFKRRFGSQQRALRCLKHVYRPEVYVQLCRNAGTDPERTDYFPPYAQPRASVLHEAHA